MVGLEHLHRRQIVVIIVAALLLFWIGEWLGEDLVIVPVVLVASARLGAVIVGTAGMVGLLLAWRHGWLRLSVALVALFSVSIGGGYWLGNHISVSAFNECVERGESLRYALREYRAVHGRYPTTLAELPPGQVPGNRLSRGNILEYESDGTGYTVVFGDWLVLHKATEGTAFHATK